MTIKLDYKQLNPQRVLITLQGRLTALNAQALKTDIHTLVGQGNREIIFDLSGVSFIDSSGLAVFISTLKISRESGGWMKLSALPEMPASIFKLTLLDKVIDIYPDVDSAIRSAEE